MDAVRICLLGCGGFIGSRLTEWLLSVPDVEVVGTDIAHAGVSHLLRDHHFSYYDSDLRHDHDLTAHLVGRSDVVVNLVTTAPGDDGEAERAFELDFMEGLRVARFCAESDTRLVQLSTGEVYGPGLLMVGAPRTPVQRLHLREDDTPLTAGPIGKTHWTAAVSKQLLERAIHAYGRQLALDYSIIRLAHLVGPDLGGGGGRSDQVASAFGRLLSSLVEGQTGPVPHDDGSSHTYLYIDDAVEAVGRVVLDDRGATRREVINIANPETHASTAELTRLMLDSYRRRYGDAPRGLVNLERGPFDVMSDPSISAGEPERVLDITKARELIDWEPQWGLMEMVTATLDAIVAAPAGAAMGEQR